MQSKPFLSYGVLVLNLSVYMAGLGVRFSLGESSGEDYFYMLAKVNDEVVQGEYYRCPQLCSSACLCMHHITCWAELGLFQSLLMLMLHPNEFCQMCVRS